MLKKVTWLASKIFVSTKNANKINFFSLALGQVRVKLEHQQQT
jgi:hypothetical protein